MYWADVSSSKGELASYPCGLGEPEQVTQVNNFTTDWPFTFSYVRVLEYDI